MCAHGEVVCSRYALDDARVRCGVQSLTEGFKEIIHTKHMDGAAHRGLRTEFEPRMRVRGTRSTTSVELLLLLLLRSEGGGAGNSNDQPRAHATNRNYLRSTGDHFGDQNLLKHNNSTSVLVGYDRRDEEQSIYKNRTENESL